MRSTSATRHFALLLLFLPWALSAADRAPSRHAGMELLVVRVVEGGTDRPILNADVLETSSGVHRLTDVRGEARIPVASTGPITLRVRQLGFQPVERTFELGRQALAAPMVIAMSRLVALASTTSETSSPCRGTADSLPSPLSLLALEQLTFGAEQYDRFWDAYPFQLSFERRTAYFSAEGKPLTVLVQKEETRERSWNLPYRPGHVVFRQGGDVRAVALSVGVLADPVFWENHCLVARHVVTVGGRRMLPLEFLPSLSVSTADYGGIAWMDSATSELRRLEFQLVGLDQRIAVKRMEGYMTFAYPSPYIARPDSIVSMWWMREPAEGQAWGVPSRVELARVAEMKYLRDRPPRADDSTAVPRVH